MHLSWPLAAVVVAAAAAFVWMLNWDLVRLYNLTASSWDLAYDQQVIWNVSQGHGFYTSYANANFLGIHFEPIFLFPALIEKFWPRPEVLLVLATAGLALAGPAAYLMFRALMPAGPRGGWLAAALALPLPFWASIQEAARDDFHPENMALAFALLLAWAGLRGHRRTTWLLALLTLMCKEDQVYTVFVAGFLIAFRGPTTMRLQGRRLMGLSVAWFVVVTGIVQQVIRAGGYSDFVYYGWLYLNPSVGGVVHALTQPKAWANVAVMLAGLCALPLLQPRWMLLMAPPLLANLMSSHVPQPYLHLHYALIVMFPLLVAGGLGARRFLELEPNLRAPALALAAIPALVLGWGNGRLPPSLNSNPVPYQVAPAYERLKPVLAVVPKDAPVSADDSLTPWFANRWKINDFPDRLQDADYVVIDRQAYLHGYIHTDKRDDQLGFLPYSGRRVIFDDGRFVVWSPVGR
jgi:uncharacterized membrane protein